MKERAWIVAAVACLMAAVAFYFHGNVDATFVASALGAVAWFISLRNRLRSEATIMNDDAPNTESDERGDVDET